MFTEAQNFAIVQTELDSVFYQNFDYDTNYPSIATARTAELFKPLQTNHAAYIEEIYKGSGLFPIIGETQSVPISTPKVANKLTTYVKDFAQGVELSKNLFDDNMHGVWSKTVADFAMVARVSQDDNAFKLFRNAFTTSLTADGAAVISTAHTLLDGETLSNVVTGALDSDTLNNAIIALRQQKNQAGVILGNVPSILLVSSTKFKKAIELTESALIADNANNAINVYRSAYGLTVYTSPYLDAVAGGSDTAWFLLSRNHSVTRLIRQGIQTNLRDWAMSNNRTYFYQANFREEVYAPDYVGIVGSTG
jgi:phage major head subunit gpT-like protein